MPPANESNIKIHRGINILMNDLETLMPMSPHSPLLAQITTGLLSTFAVSYQPQQSVAIDHMIYLPIYMLMIITATNFTSYSTKYT